MLNRNNVHAELVYVAFKIFAQKRIVTILDESFDRAIALAEKTSRALAKSLKLI